MMEIVLNVVQRGARFTICAVEEHPRKNPRSPVMATGPEPSEPQKPNRPLLEFLNALQSTDSKEHEQILRRLEWAAERGPPLNNEQQCRLLGEGLYEFKARRGTRILWFYDKGRMILCTHAFAKGGQKTPPREIARADALRKKYEAAKNRGPVRQIEDT